MFLEGFLLLIRTWEDFVETAYRLYGKEANILQQRMKKCCITRNQILCYINWTEGMTQEEIAKALNITQSGVCRNLSKVWSIWPYLFRVSQAVNHPDAPLLQYDPERDDPHVIREF